MPTVLKGMFQDRISVGQSELLTGAVVKSVCKSELTFDTTLYFIHLQQSELHSLVLVTFINLCQHIPVSVEVGQQQWTLADRNSCMPSAARYTFSGAKKRCGLKLKRRTKGHLIHLTSFPHVLMGLETNEQK